jgi:hypothetical protein
MESYERTNSIRPAGVLATACRQKWTKCNTGSPSGDRGVDQLATRERKAGLTGMAERLVVLMKPGNSGGGKEPQCMSRKGRCVQWEVDPSREESELL